MRTLDESRRRWKVTQKDGNDVASLQRAVKGNGTGSPCEDGLRSVYWKTFLLFHDSGASKDRSRVLRETRGHYETLRKGYMRFVKHPDRLAQLTVDPLTEDPESPWDIFRRDELMRAEILQDVRRLPDVSFYHEEDVQELILDVLFVYCKEHADLGGYRQGMHELLSPLVYVLHEDAIASISLHSVPEAEDDEIMEMLDGRYIEHDAYTLFAKMMDHARVFYETSTNTPAAASHDVGAMGDLLPPLAVTPSAPAPAVEQSAIVELSREIHEGALMKVDPELAVHLKNVEILPQIFLIRWIRLLFGREFSFEQHLALWDSLFALDPGFHLVPLISVAMLLRIRWKLLEGDYSVALQSLLKYPAPQPPHGSQTLVEDAIYLRDHLDTTGGAHLILKYTGRSPLPVISPTGSSVASTSRPSTPAAAFAAGLGSLRSRTLKAARSPLRSPRQGAERGVLAGASLSDAVSPPPLKASQGREGMEALFQSAAKGVLERGEKLGINRAVRDAVGEIKRNMAQSYQEARQAAAATRVSAGSRSELFSPKLDGPRLSYGQAMHMISDMERRNQQLASLLDETVTVLKAIAQAAPSIDSVQSDSGKSSAELAADLDECQQRQKRWLEEVELAAAKVQFVKVHMEDSSLILTPDNASREAPDTETKVATTSTNVVLPVDLSSSPTGPRTASRTPPVQAAVPETDSVLASPLTKDDGDANADVDHADTIVKPDTLTQAPLNTAPQDASAETTEPEKSPQHKHTIPSRSSLAQSTFSWMLQPGDSIGTGSDRSQARQQASPPSSRKPPRASAASRTRHAFLFGEAVDQSPLGGSETSNDPLTASQTKSLDGQRQPGTDGDIYRLEPLHRVLAEDGTAE
ncbi:hypothetical protein SEPCBS119000_003237 [Sporothrix epigloea]|uniref:Rab-GAP TBC domain-containing protein n=1 Tax=Sporothrix epigloea TaxID=1892477 RepID=A0ABP0DNZ4_9PEZI